MKTTALLLPGGIFVLFRILNSPVVLDLKAKAPVQYFAGDCAYFGCSFCHQEGEYINRHVYFPYKKREHKDERTKQSVKEACQKLRTDPHLVHVQYCIDLNSTDRSNLGQRDIRIINPSKGTFF